MQLLRNAHEFPRSHPEEVYFYLRHKKIEQADLDQIFSESKYWTIAHKNQKRITAVTQFSLSNLFFPAKKALDERWEVVSTQAYGSIFQILTLLLLEKTQIPNTPVFT